MDGPPGAALLEHRRDHPLRGTGAGRSGTDGRANCRSAARSFKIAGGGAPRGVRMRLHPRRFLAQRKRMLLDAPRGAPPAPYCEAPAGRPAGGVWRVGAGAATYPLSPCGRGLG